MSKSIRSTIAMILTLVLVIGLIPAFPVSAAADTSPMGEVLDSYNSNSSTFTLTDTGRVFVVAETEPAGDLLQTVQLIHRQFTADGYKLELVWGPESWIAEGDIVIRLDAASGIGADGYELNVTTTAEVTASDVDGLIYGANMILKHLRYAGSNSITGFTAADTPDTVQRAVSLDCGRKYYTKDWICNFIREMSWMGYNALQFHFSDDSGFRFDLWDENFYKGQFQPENDFSWICGSNYTSWTLSAYQADADKGKYLTTAEVVEILQTAAEYHIEVIPCFDSPSHLDYLTWTFEQHYDSNTGYSFYSTYDQKTYYAKDVNGIINYTNSRDWSTDLKWPYYSAVNVRGDLAKAFIFELYIDIANFFKEYSGSTHMSVGADEVQLSTSNISSSYSYAWGFADFVDYINELNALLNSKGYTMRMYNDFLGSTSYNAASYDFADNIQIQYWDSPFNPSSKTASNHTQPVSYYVEEGRIIYNCIQTGTYYALRKTSSGSDARSVDNRQWTFYHANEEDIWDEWYSADISEHGDYSEDTPDVPDANLGGAYFLIWGDYACVSTEKEIWNGCYDTSGSGEYYSLRDRMWSNITKMWNWDVNETVTFTSFKTVRDAYGDHPGIGTTTNSCSEETLLPAAVQPVSGYAGGCDTYVAYGQIAIANTTSIMSLPCTTLVESSSKALELGNVGEIYTAIQLLENTVGELWYKVQTKAGLVGFIRATDTTYVKDLTDDITLTGGTYPSGHVKGNYFLVKGDIAATYNTLTTAAVNIHSGFTTSGTVVTGASDTVTGNYYSLRGSTIDDNTLFGQIPLGNHLYTISVEYSSSHAEGNTLVTTTGKAYLMEKGFVVLSSSVTQSSCTHSYEETVYKESNCLESGVKFFACSKCGHVYEEAIASLGHSYEEQIIPPTCLDYEKVRYTCTLCGHSYEEYSEDAKTAWSETKPEGVDESLIETKTEYRYSDYQTKTSYETSLDGWTQIGNAWIQSGTGSVEYVNTWSAGFSTSHSLYTQYNNKANKVTAYETDTTRRVIDSDKASGYIYFHWCHSGYPYTVAQYTSYYNLFHAFYSDTFTYSAYDSSDGSYERTGSGACANSNWWWYETVYTQSYTDYNKQFTYERWTDWSDWSEIPATASDTRKVEKRTLYLVVQGELGEHSYENSICTVCGAACDHSFRNNICIDCGYEKPVLDYYLFGYINGANYACEEDSANLGEYKFVDGQLVVFFTEDSYVAVKGSDNEHWYMTEGWQGFVSSVTLYNTAKLTTADKLFVPGGTEVTFTLVDNGDDTYALSYVAVECGHASHNTDGFCTVCGDAVEHSFGTNGYCACGLECTHDMVDGVCSICGKTCDHVYENFACIHCGEAKPTYEFYLFGYINGANYACEEDFANLGEYKFVDGQVIVRFTSDSYVAIKASDNEHWYMTKGWLGQVNSAVLYNTTTLSNADKLYVPGGKEVTFTLVDNGDETYTLSYQATCAHISHSQDGICAACGETVLHALKNNVCSVCGYEKPDYDYYLFGWINGVDYADKDDRENLGIYKFEDGKLTAFFTVDSYVGVKTQDNANWYMTQGYLGQVTTATLYNAESIVGEDKLFIPAGKVITFTLVDNGDDTYVLSYTAADCPHDSHSEAGICTLCGAEVEHSYSEGFCACGKACVHVFSDGVCSICSMACKHSWRSGYCNTCGMICSHEWVNGTCSVCSMTCDHSWQDGVCTNCTLVCTHIWENGRCSVCGVICDHTYQDNVCTNCGMEKPVVSYYLCGIINGADYAYGTDADNGGTYLFVDGKLIVTFRQDSYVGLKASDGKNWYLTDGDQGQVSSVILHNGQKLTDGQLLFVPGCMEITFTLVDNGDDTLTLSYEAVPCGHAEHDAEGNCIACGTAVGHSYESVTTDATCTVAGKTVYSCACGDTYEEEIPAPGHTDGEAVTENEVAADCVNDGSYDTVVYCTVCGEEVSRVTTTVPTSGHSYESVTTDATCTESGKTVYTCPCGDSYEETIPALEHNYVDGTCTNCGAEEPAPVVKPGFEFTGASLLFEDEIFYNFYFMPSNTADVVEYGIITFTTKLADGTHADAVDVIPGAVDNGDGTYTVRTNGIPAKEMGDWLYFRVYAKLSDDSYAYATTYGYRATAYANTVLSGNSDTKTKALMVAMLNYGAAAQEYFGHNTDSLMNASLTEDQKALVDGYSADMLGGIVAADSSKTAAFPKDSTCYTPRIAVGFEGAFAVNYYFTPKHTPDGELTMYYWDAATYNSISEMTRENATSVMTLEKQSDGSYLGAVEGIAAKEVDSTIYVALVYTSGGTEYCSGILAYSLGSYFKSVAGGTSTAQPLGAAVAVYSYYAKQYFAN